MGIVYILGAFLLFIVIGAMWNGAKLRRLRRKRQGKDFSRARFIEAFRPLGIPYEIPAAVYDYYGSQKALKDFPLSPEDTYARIQRDDPDDIDEDASALVDRLGMLRLSETVRREFGDNPVTTLRDMVLWLEGMRQHQPKSTSSAL